MKLSILCYLLPLAVTLNSAEAAALTVEKNSAERSLTLKAGAKTAWTYHQQDERGKPYFHPLNMPGTETALTNHRPADHVWHLGLWFSWKMINGINFWEPSDKAETKVLSETISDTDPAAIVIRTTLSYLGNGQELVSEQRTVTVTTAVDGSYTIGWDAVFTATADKITLAATPSKKNSAGLWASGGYGGLSLRIANKMLVACSDTQGRTDVLCCGEKSEKLEVKISHPVNNDSVRISWSGHPENPRYPDAWFVRHNPAEHKGLGYFFLGPALLFHEPFTFSRGEPLRLRYTIKVEKVEVVEDVEG